jgi:hypothetical protein
MSSVGKKGRRRVRSSSKKEIPAETGTENHLSSSRVQNGKSLRLSWPFGLGLIKAITLIVIIALAGEFVIRIPNVRRQLPPPVLGTGNLTFDVTWEYLQRTLELYGHVDCVFLGSSMIKHSIDPKLFQKRFRENTGHDIVCFNFGISGMRPSEAVFNKSLVEKYNPSLLVSEVTPLFLYERFLENRNSPLISESPWGLFQSGKFSIKGWLLTHSLLFRYFMRWNIWVRSPNQYDRLQRISTNMQMDGFLMKGHGPIGKKARRPIPNPILTVLSGKIGTTKALDDWLEAFSGKTSVVFLEMPLRGKTGSSIGERERIFALSRMLLGKTVEEREGVLFSPAEQINLSKSCWMSINHLNPQGAKLFTPAFADKLAEAISTGIFEWPGDKR